MDFWETFGISNQHSFSVNEIDWKPEDDSSHICLSSAQRSKLQKVIDLFPSFESEGLPLTRLIEHTSTAKPIKQRFNPKEKILCVEIDRMIQMDVIEEAPPSLWFSPVTLHVKPGKVRFLSRYEDT